MTAIERTLAAQNIAELLDGAAAEYGDAVAFENYHNSLSFRDFGRYATDFASFLQSEFNVKKGDRIALMCPNFLAHPVAIQGILKTGAVQVSVNPMYTPSELLHQLNDSGAETLVVYSGSTEAVAKILAKTSIKRIVTIDVGDCGQNTLPSPPVDAALGAHVTFKDALEIGAGITFQPVEISREDTAFLQYTGGTTGPSKGAVLSHGNMLANVAQVHDRHADVMVEGTEVMVTALPLYHIFALCVNFICYTGFGGKNVLISNPRDMDQFMGAIKDCGFTRINGVNTLYAGMMMHPEFENVDFSKVKLAMSGGTASLKATSDRWESYTGLPIVEGYGLSETSPVLTVGGTEVKTFLGSINQAVIDTEIKLLDENDIEVSAGERGELVARGPQVMSGYHNQPEATKAAFTEDGFFRTGDIATVDSKGNYRIVDRKKDMVLVSGFNVYPNEIEQVAALCDGVQECACIGVPDERTGEAVKLFVVLSAGSEATVETIIAHCREHLTGYKVPKQIAFIDEVPKSAVGKMLRRELRE